MLNRVPYMWPKVVFVKQYAIVNLAKRCNVGNSWSFAPPPPPPTSETEFPPEINWINWPKDKINWPKDKINTPKDKINWPKDKINWPKEG